MDDNLKNSIEYLKNKVGNQPGFSVPNSYFSELESDIHSAIYTEKFSKESGFSVSKTYFNDVEEDLLQRVAEISLPKKSNLSVPTDYFDSLEDSIMNKLQKEESFKKETKVISLSSKIKKFIPAAVAASVALFISTYFFSSNPTYKFDDSDIFAWFENGYGEANTYELAMLLNSEDFIEDELSVTISKDNIEDYLINVDTSILIEIEEE